MIVLVAMCYRSRYDEWVNIYIHLLVSFYDIIFIYMANIAFCHFFSSWFNSRSGPTPPVCGS